MAHIPVIAIDGPSGSGKGVIASRLTQKFGFHLLDSGALYRLVGLAARQKGIRLEAENLDQMTLGAIASQLDVGFTATNNPENPLTISLDGTDVTARIRTDPAGVDASLVAAIVPVRKGLGELQLAFRKAPGLIADGRDMGTVVFPDADVKIFLTASAEARAQRRYNQLKDKDIGVSLHALFDSIQARDERDMSRQASPLLPAEDAFVIDSTDLDIEQVMDQVLIKVTEKLG